MSILGFYLQNPGFNVSDELSKWRCSFGKIAICLTPWKQAVSPVLTKEQTIFPLSLSTEELQICQVTLNWSSTNQLYAIPKQVWPDIFLVLHNAKRCAILIFMKPFGETIRELRIAQDIGLREAALKIGISPAYLSRIERGKESPPRPDIIKALAKLLAADPDVLFRLSSSTDPEIANYLHTCPEALRLLRFIIDANFDSSEIEQLIQYADLINDKSWRSFRRSKGGYLWKREYPIAKTGISSNII